MNEMRIFIKVVGERPRFTEEYVYPVLNLDPVSRNVVVPNDSGFIVTLQAHEYMVTEVQLGSVTWYSPEYIAQAESPSDDY